MRPTIVNAPSNMTYGSTYGIRSDKALREAVLISLGSMTHSIDMNQRYVQLAFSNLGLLNELDSGTSTGEDNPPQPLWIGNITAPANSQIAPPGYYMLFVLRRQGEGGPLVPSVAKIIHLQ